jgi:predicted ATP-grasp superfamily ATP-dependent carboligase
MGSMDLVRPLALAGIRSAVVSRPGSPSLYSRHVVNTLPWPNFSERSEALVEALLGFAAAQPEPPVLFYEEDAQLLLVSRHRDRLAQSCRFLVADPQIVEGTVDKAQFADLAARLRLPVPRTRRIRPGAGDSAEDIDLAFPLILKPLTRRPPWDQIGGSAKALEVASAAELHELWPRLHAVGMELIAQEMVAGPETGMESYHVYIDAGGAIAGEFTGRKIRTYPEALGHSTALEISDAPDVTKLGRATVESLGLRGVAKLDFKRGPDRRLHLLEINARYNLWHHLGAVAGVNLPALVYADLVGARRPATRRATPGARWCSPWNDLPAARAHGVPLAKWLPWALGCEAKSALAWDDPMPVLRAVAARLRRGRTGDRVSGGRLHSVWS